MMANLDLKSDCGGLAALDPNHPRTVTLFHCSDVYRVESAPLLLDLEGSVLRPSFRVSYSYGVYVTT